MSTALTRILLSLLLLLPLAAHAGDAQDFVAANPAKQASLLERWSAAPDAARLPLIEALQQGRVAADSAKNAFIETDGAYQPAEGDAQPVETPKKLRLNNRLRGLTATALASHQLLGEDPALPWPLPSNCRRVPNRRNCNCSTPKSPAKPTTTCATP